MKINLISTDVEIFKKQLSSNWKTDGYEFFSIRKKILFGIL